MKIVWDEPKRQANIAKHGMDFADVVFFGWETALIAKSHTNRSRLSAASLTGPPS
jgi:uncharacterized DUF497 family protein